MKKIAVLFSTASAMVLLLSSCKDSSKFEGYTKADNGLYYKFYNQAENGVKPKEGDVLSLRYKFMLQKNDSVFMDSKDASRDGSGLADIGVQKSSFAGSLEDGLMLMSKGDSASFIVPADSFFLKTMRMNELPKFVKSGDHIKATIAIKEVRSKQQMEEEQKKMMAQQEAMIKEMEANEKPSMDKYIADNNIKVKPTAKGIYYIETSKGSGSSPKLNDVVKVNYTGKLLDGKTFDSNAGGAPVEFALTEGQLIQGWVEGLQLMKKGGKGTLLIPSNLCYGPRGNQGIPPFAPLVFEIELLDFHKAPAAQPAGAPQPH